MTSSTSHRGKEPDESVRPGRTIDPVAERAGAHQLFRTLDEHRWFHEQQDRVWVRS